MKLFSRLSIFLIILTCNIAQPQVETDFLSPSLYYTFGDYSDGKTSRSISGYATLTLNFFDHIYLGYDNLRINDAESFYDQNMFVSGFIKNLYPFYLRFNYSHIKGEFDVDQSLYRLYSLDPDTIKSFDYTNLYNLGVSYNYGYFYFGINYTYLNAIGYIAVKSHSIEPVIDWVIDPKLVLRAAPNYTSVSDDRNLKSLYFRVSYYPTTDLFLYFDGFVGERAYYFNPELLTIFNLNQTQLNLFGFKAEYLPVPKLKIMLGFQNTKFSTHSINYFSAGIRYSIAL